MGDILAGAGGSPHHPHHHHHQCARCHAFYVGPHSGANPGQDINIVTDEGEMLADSSAESIPRRNVSHGMCPTCLPEWEAEARADLERRRAAKAAEATQEG